MLRKFTPQQQNIMIDSNKRITIIIIIIWQIRKWPLAFVGRSVGRSMMMRITILSLLELERCEE